MTAEGVVGIVGTIVGIASLAFAIYQGVQRKRLQEIFRAHAWHLLQMNSNANGHVQAALTVLLEAKINGKLIDFMARADAFGQSVHREVVRQISFSESSFDYIDV